MVRPAHAALLVACVACNASPAAVEPPAQPAEIVSAASIPPPLAISTSTDRLDPDVARRYRDALKTGAAHTASGDYPAAIAAFSAALVDVPDDPRALAGRGHAHLLASDLDAAAADLHAAASHASEVKLAAQIHLDLAALAERTSRADEALKQYALAVLHDPTSPAADKLAGRTTCLADITVGDKSPADPNTRPTSWLELWTTYFEPSKANLKDPSKPADENSARHRVCHYEALALDACAGQPPWVLHIPGGKLDPQRDLYADQYVLVDLTSAGSLAVAPLAVLELGTPCDDHHDVAIVARDPLVVRTTRTASALGEVCDTAEPDAPPHCHDDCVQRRITTTTTVHARDTLQILLTVTTPNRPDADRPLADVAVTPTSATISGAGCDRTITFPTK